MDTPNIETLLDAMALQLKQRIQASHITAPLMIGIHSGGVWVAERLHKRMQLSDPLGTLDISFYRDDFTKIGLHPEVRPSKLPHTTDQRDIVLVDDVLYTGRTIRAALNEIFDYGRPKSVKLAVLVERSGRELPIQADIVGLSLPLADNEYADVSGPEPLQLHIIKNPCNHSA